MEDIVNDNQERSKLSSLNIYFYINRAAIMSLHHIANLIKICLLFYLL